MKKEIELFRKSKEIANRIGENGVRSIGIDKYGYDILTACKVYKFDKLRIYDSGQIYYNDDLVFDKEMNKYSPDFWEELFDELYDSLDIIEEEQKEKRAKEKQIIEGKDFYDYYFRNYKNLDDSDRELFDDLLAIRGIETFIEKSESDETSNEYYKVFKNDICVYSISIIDYRVFINEFVNSSWTREFAGVREAIEQMNEMNKKKEIRESVEKSLQKLTLKKKNYMSSKKSSE